MYPGEKQHVAYQDYVLDHAMGDAPGNKNGKRMSKSEWIEYTEKGRNKMASGGKEKPGNPTKQSPMNNIRAM